MTLWRKLTDQWPRAVSNWFWSGPIAFPAEQLEKLTVKRLILGAVFLALVIAFGQIFTVDVALAFAGDLIIYFDVASFILLMAAQQHIPVMMRTARRVIHSMARRGSRILTHRRLKAPRRRRVRLPSVTSKDTLSSDDDGVWGGGRSVLTAC
jgi:hypothetical protein